MIALGRLMRIEKTIGNKVISKSVTIQSVFAATPRRYLFRQPVGVIQREATM